MLTEKISDFIIANNLFAIFYVVSFYLRSAFLVSLTYTSPFHGDNILQINRKSLPE
jgi:hypothetical protein